MKNGGRKNPTAVLICGNYLFLLKSLPFISMASDLPFVNNLDDIRSP